MIIVQQEPKIERRGEMSFLVFWLCEPFDLEFSFRRPLAEIEKTLSAVLELPLEVPREDFVEGHLTWWAKEFSVYFERSLGYAEFSSSSEDDVRAVLDTLHPTIRLEE